MCKLLLSITSYVLPCIGFVVFFIKQSRSITMWEKRRDDLGRIGLEAQELNNLGGLMQGEVKKARCDTLLEGSLVILGAICGILTLFA